MMNLFSPPRRRIFLRRSALALPLAALLLSGSGCRRSEIKTYMAPKEGEFSYSAPVTWKELPGDGRSVAQYQCPTPQGDVNISITTFGLGAMEGRDELLVSMWRGALKLPELSEEEAKKAVSPVQIGDAQGQIFEVTGEPEGQPVTRIITAFSHQGGKSWFFKLQGPPAAVDSQKAIFLEFLKTVTF